ncbi:MAG: carboxypeptidase regulatory-like domain-containing protein [Sulfurovum sp.]|nr:carboxypeptidase regulatory-like domain-containing protein [Sulfurovum sp.]
MFKRIALLSLTLLTLSVLTGCTRSRLSSKNSAHNSSNNNQSWADQTNVDDVDISDLDENLKESEMMMTESGQVQKIARINFPSSEYNRLARTGKGTVRGTIYLKDSYEKGILGANTRLYLNPLTSYSKQWYKESYLGGAKMTKADSRLFNYLKFTASDENGKFAFYGVPSGSYYLIGTVKCGQECGYGNDKNIRIARKVTIEGNQILEKDLTRMID